MGLIKAAMGAAGGVMADQWKEFFYCDAIPAEVLAVKGQSESQAALSTARQRQHHLQRLCHRRGRWPVHDDRRAGEGGRRVRRAGRVYL